MSVSFWNHKYETPDTHSQILSNAKPLSIGEPRHLVITYILNWTELMRQFYNLFNPTIFRWIGQLPVGLTGRCLGTAPVGLIPAQQLLLSLQPANISQVDTVRLQFTTWAWFSCSNVVNCSLIVLSDLYHTQFKSAAKPTTRQSHLDKFILKSIPTEGRSSE